MFTAQQVTGPVVPGQAGPLQVSGPSAYYPTQTTDPYSGMFTSMMPMIMMMAIMMPMLKGVTASSKS